MIVLALGLQNLCATVLIFEPSTNFANLSPDYGDRVTTANQGGLFYGLTGGPTPNVVVDYTAAPKLWMKDYGDLQNVIYSGGGSNLDIILRADAGYLVQLYSFDMAGWLRTDYTIRSVGVYDINGQPLFSQNDVLIQGDSVGPQHTSFAFASPLSGPLLRISFDPTGSAFNGEDAGIDNIQFTQVPEPSTLTLSAMILLVAWWLVRKRSQAVRSS
jgi:hypothetical protein